MFTPRRKRKTLLILAVCCLMGCAAASDYFRIQVVDDSTGRGIPLVVLETVNQVQYVTDSAGMAAVYEPGLMGKQVFFHVRSHGYIYPEDHFGYRGVRPKLEPGGSITVKMKRINIAERLYRVTGQGIYRDSVLLGDDVPVEAPLLNGGVLGQDSVVNALYRGRLYWFWGDTNRAAYPLGQFAVSGAISELPGKGGLDPAKGVNLTYFVDEQGFSKKMCPIQGPGPVWIYGLMVLKQDGLERLYAHFARMKDLGTRLEHGVVLWNDEKEIFERASAFPLDAPLHPAGHPILVQREGEDWFYFPDPFPVVRVRARAEDLLDPTRYEGYTCLRTGARWRDDAPELDRDKSGALRWSWKRDTAHVDGVRWRILKEKKLVKQEEGRLDLEDVETGSPIVAHRGSIYWNRCRKKWASIFVETWGRSMLGEVWYTESNALEGPWKRARRIVTHDKYSFYNVKQHPYFDQEGGRFIYFEGTYTSTFSGSPRQTPRYDYNQIMYRLDLDDPRLHLVE